MRGRGDQSDSSLQGLSCLDVGAYVSVGQGASDLKKDTNGRMTGSKRRDKGCPWP